jgi:hypothetical protein
VKKIASGGKDDQRHRKGAQRASDLKTARITYKVGASSWKRKNGVLSLTF